MTDTQIERQSLHHYTAVAAFSLPPADAVVEITYLRFFSDFIIDLSKSHKKSLAKVLSSIRNEFIYFVQ